MNNSERRTPLTEGVVTCVYCGMAYPQGTPTHGVAILTEHIKICPKHPMRDLETRLAATETALAEERAKREQAEASCAAMRKTLNDIAHATFRAEKTPESICAAICLNAFPDAGTAILARLTHMEEALEQLADEQDGYMTGELVGKIARSALEAKP